MYFQYLGLRKTWLNKCLKGCVSEDPPTDNMGNGLKQCRNLNESTLTIFVNHCEGNCLGASPF